MLHAALAVLLPPLLALLPLQEARTAGAVREEGLAALRSLLEETGTRAAVVLHRDEPVAEWYWKGAGADTEFEVWSVSKSFASTCIGLLIDEGAIESIDEPVAKYLPSFDGGKRSRITLRHLLEQTSGLAENTGRFIQTEDQLQAALEAPVETNPGEVSRYNNVGCNVLSAIITEAAGLDPEEYMRIKVWDPIGMEQTWWRRDGAGNVITYAGIQTTASELARFGQLFLDGGTWKGERILSEKWVHESTTRQTTLSLGLVGMGGSPYGYLWWLDAGGEGVPHNYSALGLYGNHLTVIPELDLVGVRLVGSDPQGAGLMTRVPEWVEALAGVVRKPGG